VPFETRRRHRICLGTKRAPRVGSDVERTAEQDVLRCLGFAQPRISSAAARLGEHGKHSTVFEVAFGRKVPPRQAHFHHLGRGNFSHRALGQRFFKHRQSGFEAQYMENTLSIICIKCSRPKPNRRLLAQSKELHQNANS